MSFNCPKPKEAISLIRPWSGPNVRGLETTYYACDTNLSEQCNFIMKMYGNLLLEN